MSLTGRKHPRDEMDQSDETMVGLYDLYSGDLRKQMLSFASIHDLCTFDALGKNFKALAESRWKELVYEETGMKNGKADWNRYVSFLKEPISVSLVDDEDHGYGCGFGGTPHVATNGSIVVMTSDDRNTNDRAYPSDESEVICVRDGYSLNFSRLVSSPINPFKLELCGRVGSEIIVMSNWGQVAAVRGNDSQLVCRLCQSEPENPNGLPLLGCETHLVVSIGNCLKLYRVETDTASPEMLTFKQSVVTSRKNEPEESRAISIAWGSDKSSFVYCRGTEISVWSFDAAKDTLEQMKLINYDDDDDLEIDNVALGDAYVVGSSTDRCIHIWDRITGEKLPHVLCDVEEEDDRLDPYDIIHCLKLWCCGRILISSSHLGHKICVWDMKSGELLKEHPLDLDELPEGSDIIEIAYLPHLNGFLVVSSYFTTFIAFATNERQSGMAKSIKRRERRIEKALF